MSMVERNKINVNMIISIDTSPIATFYWNSVLGDRLRELRDSSGYSRRKLAELSGISEQYIQQLESPHLFSGKLKKAENITVSQEILSQLCKVLQVSIAELVWSGSLGGIKISSSST